MAEPLGWLYHLLVIGPYLVFPVVLAGVDGRRGTRLERASWWLGVPVWLVLVSLIVAPSTARAMATCTWLYVILVAANWLVIRKWWHPDSGRHREWCWALGFWLGSLVHATLIAPSIPYGPAGGGVVGCQANLRTIGVALQSYTDMHTCLPPPVRSAPDGGEGTSWRTTILPFIGHEDLYNSYNADVSWTAPANSTAARTVVHTYLCPAQCEPSRSPMKFDLLLRGPKLHTRGAHGYALTHYSAVTGPSGALRTGQAMRLARLRGGRGPACLAGEVYLRDWPWAAPEDVTWTGTTHPPYSVLGFDSAHDDVLLFLMADGTVRAVPRDIDPALLRRMLCTTIAAPDEDQY